MNVRLLFLPFLAIFTLSLGLTLSGALSEEIWVSYSLYAFSGVLMLAWVLADLASFRVLLSRKGARYGASSTMNLVLGLLVIIGLGFLSNRDRFNVSVDVTRDSLNTLSDQSLKIVSQFDSDTPVTILSFFESEVVKAEFNHLLSLYRGAGLRVNLEQIDPKADPTRAIAEKVTTVDTVIMKYRDKDIRLTDYSEEKFSNGLMGLLKDGVKTVYFVEGHGEKPLDGQDSDGYKLIQDELVSERFAVKSINLMESGQIPNDASLLVIAGPRYDYQENEIALIDSYLKEARPALFMLDAMTNIPNVKGLLKDYGLRVNDDMLILRPDDPRSQLLGQNNALVTDFDEFSPATKDFAGRGAVTLVVPNSRSIGELTENKMAMKPKLLARTADMIIGVNQVTTPKDLESITADRISGGPFALIAIAEGQVGGEELAQSSGEPSQKSDVKKEVRPAKELRLSVIGSSEMVSNLGVQRGENVDMFLNLVNYLVQDETFISIRPKEQSQSVLDLSSNGSQVLLLFIAYLYPTMFLGGGIFFWIRRRKA